MPALAPSTRVRYAVWAGATGVTVVVTVARLDMAMSSVAVVVVVAASTITVDSTTVTMDSTTDSNLVLVVS